MTVTFNTPDLTNDDFRRVRNEICGHIASERTKTFTSEDLAFWQPTQHTVPSPEKYGEGKFREKARQHWNREYAGKHEDYTHHDTYGVAAMRYPKLKEQPGV